MRAQDLLQIKLSFQQTQLTKYREEFTCPIKIHQLRLYILPRNENISAMSCEKDL